MEARGEKGSLQDFSAHGSGTKAKLFNYQYECSSCRKVYKYRTALENHMPTCMGNTAVAVQMEAQEDILNNAVRCRAGIKLECGIIGASPETFENSRVTKTEVHAGHPTTANAKIIQVPETVTLENITIKIEDEEIEEFQAIDDRAESQPSNALSQAQLSDTFGNPPHLELQMSNNPTNASHSIPCEILYDDKKSDAKLFGFPVTSDEEEKQLNLDKSFLATPVLKHRRNNPKNKINQTGVKDTQIEDLRNTYSVVKNQRSSQCHICFKNLKTIQSLRQHLIQHTSRFKCEHCSKTFQGAFHLEEHIQSHLGIKPHQCSVCHMAFTSASNLKNHMRTHSGEGHKCHICGRAFFKKVCLDDHRNVHLGTKPYKCHLCPKSYASRGCLWIHKNGYHKQST